MTDPRAKRQNGDRTVTDLETMPDTLERRAIIPEGELPDAAEIIARGRASGREVTLGPSAFLAAAEVGSEADYKRREAAKRRIMLHAQIGYRDLAKTQRAWAEIHDAVAAAGGQLDRYGICLDWSMGYPAKARAERPRGTGLMLPNAEDFAALTAMAPVAPHFGDFVLGMPAALENTAAALAAGASSIGNLGQYFTFRLPGWEDDIGTTEATLEALALLAAQPVEIIVHSNLDDGFAALFTDLACAFGAVLLERHIVEGLLGGKLAHCYGHSFSEPLTRLAFQRALAQSPGGAPGTMIYGNTVAYDGSGSANYAALARYLTVDALGQSLAPTGHAVNPVPITEAERIPDIDEVIDAQLFALRLIEQVGDYHPLLELSEADRIAARLISAGETFKASVLHGLTEAGFDTEDPFELLLALRRIGARRLESLFGPGDVDPETPHGRAPLVKATTIAALERAAEKALRDLNPAARDRIAAAGLTVCLGATDVHEYGKILIAEILRRLQVRVLDAGVHAEPDDMVARALAEGAEMLAISTYNGVALSYLQEVKAALAARGAELPLLIGGKLNQIAKDSNSSLPVDVSQDLAAAGAVVCPNPAVMLRELLDLAEGRQA